MEYQRSSQGGQAWLSVCGVLCAAALASAVGAAPTGDTYETYSGTATSARSGEFLYRENHVLQYHGGRIEGRVVLYTCRDGAPFARKTVSYVDSLSPDFLLEDVSNGMREGVRTEGNVRQVFFRGDSVAPEKSDAIPRVNGMVVDSGFEAFVRTNWLRLMDGRSLGMNFLVPSRLQEMSFKVEHLRSDHTDGIPVEVFRLKLSGVLGWVAPSIDVYYGARDHDLIRYVGLSDLRDPSHDNFNANIDFQPDERRPGDEQSMARALRAKLVPCR
jgi:hypothetical protein